MPGTVAAWSPLVLLIVGLWAVALVRLARVPAVPYLPRWAWAVVIVALTPWGAAAFLLLTSRARTPVSEPAATPAPRVAVPPSVPGPAAPRPGGAPPVVRTCGLTRAYGPSAGLFDVDLAVPDGSVYGLVGRNGAGKTTLLSLLTGTRRADRGDIDLGVPRSAVAVCPDVPEFEPWLSAFEVVDLARHLVAPRLGPDAVLAALATTGLQDVADRRVGGFSRGMMQRLGLASAIVGDPRLLILDEPTSALDPAGRAELLDLVAGMRGSRTVIFSSHILADVQRVADQVGVLRDGRLLYQGSTDALVDEHLSPRWSIRVATAADRVAAALRAEPWALRVEPAGQGRLTLEADTMEHGELGIPAVLAACRARLVACEPLAADLESAFLALTGTEASR